MDPRSTPRRLAAAFLLLLTLVVFHRALFLGEAFLPADQLRYLAPWNTQAPTHPWNVLRFDGITQFYPWRLEMVREWRSGTIPTVNPFAFAADGGTPLLANSQAAPFYLPNLIFVLLGESNVWFGFGLVAALHLWLAAKGTYLFARSQKLSRAACLLSATVFTLSGPVICWLALPTFLCAATWLPWLLLLIHKAHQPMSAKKRGLTVLGIALLVAQTILAGHLQVAFYVLLAALAYSLALGISGLQQKTIDARGWLLALGLSLLMGVALSAVQVLPALALSKISHRTPGTYDAFVANALPWRSLVTFLVPDFFGHPNKNGGFFWNLTDSLRPNNYGEWAVYVGVAPLFLSMIGALATKQARFFALFTVVALLIAFGTAVNLPLFYLAPGYKQFGNPGRILFLAAFGFSILSGFGLDALGAASKRVLVGAVAFVFLLVAVGAAQGAAFAGRIGVPFGAAMDQASNGIRLAGAFTLLTLGLIGAFSRFNSKQRQWARRGFVGLALVDLVVWGWGYNPSAPWRDVYPVTPGIAWLQVHGKDALIASINDRWAMDASGPKRGVLPPNALTVYGLHDIAGYDSLFVKSSKDRIEAATGADPCPPENGNMVFIKTVDAAVALGAKYIVVSPERTVETNLAIVYDGPDLRIYENPTGRNAPPQRTDQSKIVLVGLVISLLSTMILMLGVWFIQRQTRVK